MLKIVQVLSSIDVSTGGPARSVTSLIQGMTGLISNDEFLIELHCISSEDPIIDDFSSPMAKIKFHNSNYFGKMDGFQKCLDRIHPDILHGHGLWQIPVHQMAKYGKKNNIPYVITPRGMLEPWALNSGKIKKKMALALYQKNDLADATCIHATADMETTSIRKQGLKNPIAVIPNGINVNNFQLPENREPSESKTILFLSRIHPKKGIEFLIQAWVELEKSLRQGWKIEIAGNGDKNYIISLRKLIHENKLADEIEIIGPQFNHEKERAYHRADLFVLPTHSENFGVVVAEALAYGVPVITTKGAPWEDLETYGAGWWIDVGAEPLRDALSEALKLPKSKLLEMGLKGRKLVEKEYSIQSTACAMSRVYDWILGKGEKPNTIYN